MKRKTTLYKKRMLCSSVVLASVLSISSAVAMDAVHSDPATFKGKPYSPYANRAFPSQVLFGDVHVHTGLSGDAGGGGTRLMPRDAYRFARGAAAHIQYRSASAYLKARSRWKPLVEVTQPKGDGEAHPLLSPDDAFADFETWDTGNLDMSEAKTPEG